ncbi:hypothetical protein DY000_02039641 [Brassica cretica]|uniref:Uncharacterized protein n=1 Tax=Brassica cretica TaxID=69181 RepID=A0ABQ7BP59_BRACR|nr:hypothetical protein DY000_02039641 [Brassica cretica]
MLDFATLMVGFTTVLIDTSNTSPDSCVIYVKVGVVCDPIQSDSTTHDHSDALFLPSAHVDPVYDEPYQDRSHLGCNTQSRILTWPSENYKKDVAASYLEMNAMSCWSRVKNYFREVRSSWTDFKSSRSSILYARSFNFQQVKIEGQFQEVD